MITPPAKPAPGAIIPVSPFAPEDTIRLQIILAQLNMIETDPAGYWRSLYFGWKLSFAGAWAAVRVHLFYLRQEISRVSRSARAAHWRLDTAGAPPAPLELR